MSAKSLVWAGAMSALLLGVVGCGGSDGGADAAVLPTAYNSGLAALNTRAGLQSAAFVDLFDPNFLDAGYTKLQLVDNLAQDAASTAVSADLSMFPSASLANASVGNCASSGICTLTGTLTNTDADTTEVPFTAQVMLSNGAYRLLGDQKSS
ncbi:MAG: hypothetical protein H7322_17485 [Ramlibacter sp.]|nr:hypothetical protein [Ramlibacter sp.]